MISAAELRKTTEANGGLNHDQIIAECMAHIEKRVKETAGKGENQLSDVTWNYHPHSNREYKEALHKFANESGCKLWFSTTNHGSEFFHLEW